MKSHFQRSDGFDACSQCFARHRLRERQRRQIPASSVDAGEPRRDVGADVARRSCSRTARRARRARFDQNLPVLHRFAGRRDRARRALQPALVVRIRRFLLDDDAPGSTKSAARARSVSSTPWTISSGSVPRCARVDNPRDVADRAIRARDRTRTAPTPGRPRPPGAAPARSASPTVVADVAGDEAEHARAVDVRRVDRRHLELRARPAAASAR